MQGTRLFVPLVLLCSLLVVGCSGGGGKFSVTTPPSSTTAPASLTLTDMPPANVTVLSFQVTITGAVLNPGNVSLVSAPITIEITRLQTENAFLSTLNVPAGTYNSITITFANPVLTFKNDTAGMIANCPNTTPNNVCEIKLGVAGSVMFSGAPFPVTVTANTPAGLLVDLSLNNVISGTVGIDFNAAGGVTVTQLPSVQLTGQLAEIDDVTGQVTSKDAANNQFTLQTSQGPLTIKVDSNTVFQDFGSVCSSNNFACVAVNQIVEVDAILQGGGALLARHVEFKDNDVSEAEVEGVIFSSGATPFRMVALDGVPNVTGLNVGDVVTVNVGSSTTFSVDNEGLATSSFLSSADLLVGQEVQVKLLSTSSGTTANADRVRLRMSRFTATVAGAPSGSSFTVNNLPGLFTSAGINQIQVQTSTQTEFEGVAGVTGLAASNTVSLRGLLFKQISGIPILVAEKIRKRS